MKARPLPILGAVMVALLIASGCAAEDRPQVVEVAPGATEVKPDAVPASILGLTSAPEDVNKAFEEAKNRAYITSIRMWSLREGKRLRATVQVARFAPDASPERESFRRTVVAQVGQTAPRTRKVGDQIVYVTAANKQAIFMWFDGIHFVLLSVAADYPNPRALLRNALEQVEP